MRLYYYKMINEMAETLREALCYIRKTGELSMMKICVQSLQSIIGILNSNADGIKDTSVIENINALLKQLASEKIDIEKAVSLSDKLVSGCKNGLCYKIKVLFVAELGGKWDSMESVYEECMKRDDIDVDVVLEPVFREVKLPNGKIRHEEANYDWLTPMGIKHIPYKNYDMKKESPDITFFSQPYDGCTDPKFWPENMSKYTRVVYLPYYAGTSLEAASPVIDSFFRLPSQTYSWRIACQSDLMKKYYRVYASRKGENVVVTGIPKWDRPMCINKDNTPCPKGWKEKINGRKVFLWNTHFDTYGKYKEPFYYEKQMIELFLNRKDKAALIWRTHPMTETVIKTYTPELLPMYKQIIREVEESPNILIDKESSYSYSFVWSDALISWGRSSMVFQYLLMDKPVVTFVGFSKEDFYKVNYTYDNILNASCKNITNNIYEMREIGLFVDDITDDVDKFKNDRKIFRESFYKYADGKVGKRLTQKLVDDLLKELGLSCENDKKDETFLVIGSEQDSRECIEHLKSRNAVHRLCSDIVSCDEKEKKELFSCTDPRDNKYYVITSKDNEAVLMEMLVSLYNVPKERIIPFWKMFDIASQSMICDRIISDKTQVYDGIILGSSNSSCGFLEEKLDGNWCNMSAAYQDMYYIKCSLRHCINSAPDKFRNLKYAVIDLQDSFFFNYDVSVSKNIVDYLADGGYSMESHHFSRNKYFRCRFKELVQKVSDEKNNKIKKDVLTIWDKYFKDIEEKLTAEKSNITAGLEMMKEDSANDSINIPEHALTLSEKTVKENLSALCDTIDMLKKLSPDIKIYTTMIPHYMKTDQDMLSVIHQHVVYFRDILEKLKNMYGITHIDINSISDVSVERCCYKTPLLLNRLGAEMVTGVLRDTIMGK